MCKDYKIIDANLFHQRAGKVSTTADEWSPKVFCGFITVTAHFIVRNWKLKSITHKFKRFPTPHTKENTCVILQTIFINWKICKDVQCIATNNASDICREVRLLFQKLKADHSSCYASLDAFYVRCVAHVLNFKVR